jgi:hypothetical protein
MGKGAKEASGVVAGTSSGGSELSSEEIGGGGRCGMASRREQGSGEGPVLEMTKNA